MSSEQRLASFKERTEAIRNIAVTVAVIIGGLWAVFTFLALRQSALASAQLKEAELRLTRQTAVEVEVEAEQLHLPNDDGLYISATVKLINKGSKPARLVYKVEDDDHSESNPTVPQLAVAAVEFRSDGSPQFRGDKQVFESSVKSGILNIPAKRLKTPDEDTTKLPIKDREVMTWQLLRVGPTYRIPFVVKVTDPGFYYVDFRVRVAHDAEEQEVYVKEFQRKMKAATLSGSTFVSVSSEE